MSIHQRRLDAIAAQYRSSKPAKISMARSILELDENWGFKQSGPDAIVPDYLPTARFPTDVYSDLLHHGLIPNPFRGMNEQEVQWVSEKTWLYQTSFQTPKDAFTTRKAVLIFDGLDTFAAVILNGVEILRTDNMFIRYEVDVRRLLHLETDNILEIRFENAVEKADNVMKSYPNHKWGTMGGDPKRTAVRKAQYHFGWDWGPRIVTSGPWKAVRLETYYSKISDIQARPLLDSTLETANIDMVASVDGDADTVDFELSIEGSIVSTRTTKVIAGVASANVQVENPKLWWPFTHGAQPLYTLRAYLVHGHQEQDSSSLRFGIRKVELIQQPLLDQDGTSFFFRVNNVPMFLSGSCWIPADSLTTRITAQKYRSWVSLARSGNQAMIRVWGGGIFEHAALYDACDELGVLVWQDFMFACGNYPTHHSMLDSIKIEAEQNVIALRNHPSIVLWAGNNEDYLWVLLASLEYNPEDKDPESWLRTNFPARYIYEHLLPEICHRLVPDLPYHPGSPFGGLAATDPESGDLHQWGVWHMEQAPYQEYPNMGGRFVSEFGMQAFPIRRTAEEYFADGDSTVRDVEGEMARWHNKADGAEDRLKRYLDFNFAEDEVTFDSHIYHTQLLQSEAVGTAYRSWKRGWRGPGREYCGGALVWQLNDCWPVTSWAIVDFYLRPKMAYWAVKRESASQTVGLQRTTDGIIEAWAVNLTLLPKTVDIVLKIWDIRDGKELMHKVAYQDFILEVNQSTELMTLKIPEASQSPNIAVAAYVLESESKTLIARHVNFHEPLKEVPLQHPKELSCRVYNDIDSTRVELSAEVPVKGVLVEIMGDAADNISFEDNGVDLVPGETLRLNIGGVQKGDHVSLATSWLGGSRLFS